jgi:hypothetical protein
MILDMNIKLEGINKDFLEELDELIEDTRVEYFIINPLTKDEVKKTKSICHESERFKYTLPIEFKDLRDDNCIAMKITQPQEITLVQNSPIVVISKYLTDNFIEVLNDSGIRGVVLDAKESDNRLINFTYAISHNSLANWSKSGITHTDYNRLALQSDYPTYSYNELIDGLLKDISDLTFRAEQTIAAGGTRTILRTFGLL